MLQVMTSSSTIKGIHGKIEVRNRVCDHVFLVKVGNILDGATVCGVCGPTKRAAIALKGYVDKYGRTYDITKWADYKREVWVLTNLYYKANVHKLNPMGLPRRRAGSHPDAVNLDHLIPMIYCFKNKLPIEFAADPENIRMIPAVENLSKKQTMTPPAAALLTKLKVKYS